MKRSYLFKLVLETKDTILADFEQTLDPESRQHGVFQYFKSLKAGKAQPVLKEALATVYHAKPTNARAYQRAKEAYKKANARLRDNLKAFVSTYEPEQFNRKLSEGEHSFYEGRMMHRKGMNEQVIDAMETAIPLLDREQNVHVMPEAFRLLLSANQQLGRSAHEGFGVNAYYDSILDLIALQVFKYVSTVSKMRHLPDYHERMADIQLILHLVRGIDRLEKHHTIFELAEAKIEIGKAFINMEADKIKRYMPVMLNEGPKYGIIKEDTAEYLHYAFWNACVNGNMPEAQDRIEQYVAFADEKQRGFASAQNLYISFLMSTAQWEAVPAECKKLISWCEERQDKTNLIYAQLVHAAYALYSGQIESTDQIAKHLNNYEQRLQGKGLLRQYQTLYDLKMLLFYHLGDLESMLIVKKRSKAPSMRQVMGYSISNAFNEILIATVIQRVSPSASKAKKLAKLKNEFLENDLDGFEQMIYGVKVWWIKQQGNS